MKTITVPTRAKTLSDLLKKAEHTDLILQSQDGTQFVLARVRDSLAFSFYVGESNDSWTEATATRKNKKLMKFLEKRAARAKEHKGVPFAKVKQQINL